MLDMGKNTTLKYYDERDLAEVISKCLIIEISSNLDEFKDWLREYHKKEFSEELFLGYRFFIETAIRTVMYSIENGNIDFEQDFEFYRASFKGVKIEDVPNTCEGVIALKRIWNICKKLRKSKISTIASVLDQIQRLIIKPFMTVFEIYASSVVEELDKYQALKYSAIFYLNLYFNDSHMGLPFSYFLTTTMFKGSLTKEYLKRVYLGYAYTLQFVWFKLLGDEFKKTKLVDLHRACEIYSKKVEELIELEIGIPITEEELLLEDEDIDYPEKDKLIQVELSSLTKEEIDHLNRQKKELEEIMCWYALDEFFTVTSEEIVKPILRKFSIRIPFSSFLKFTGEIDRIIFSDLLDPEGINDPEYMRKEDENSIKKEVRIPFPVVRC